MTSAKERAVEAGARSDAEFDGRSWEALSRAERERYLARSRKAQGAAFPILAEDADDALRRVSEWAAAYPADVFPEVDLEKAKAALEAAGIDYSALHGTWARHIMNGVAGIVDPARARIQQMAEAL